MTTEPIKPSEAAIVDEAWVQRIRRQAARMALTVNELTLAIKSASEALTDLQEELDNLASTDIEVDDEEL